LRVVVSLALILAFTAVLAEWLPGASAQEPPPAARSDAAPQGWDATAPGRVEPRSQPTRIAAPVAGRIAEVLVKPNDKVFPGELLVRLDDDEASARLAVAEAQAALRQRARNDEKKKGSAERRRAEDAVADAERSFARAQAGLDRAVVAARRALRAPAEDAAVNTARSALSQARDQLRQQRDALRDLKEEGALPTRAEGELEVARADWTLAEVLFERTRIRAPFAGTVLQVNAKAGEVAGPSPEQPLILLGDLSALRVRTELDERDFNKVRVGQGVVVKAYAFKDRTFSGTVQSIAQIVGPGRMSSHGSRNKLTDVDVLEVIVDLIDPGPLVVGMEVDVYFRSDGPARQGAAQR
jgi:HlyD family secretion protein